MRSEDGSGEGKILDGSASGLHGNVRDSDAAVDAAENRLVARRPIHVQHFPAVAGTLYRRTLNHLGDEKKLMEMNCQSMEMNYQLMETNCQSMETNCQSMEMNCQSIEMKYQWK